MSSRGHPGLASCVSLPETVLSGSSDSNRIRLCGASHGIVLILSGTSAYGICSVSSSSWRFRPPGWGGVGPYRFSVNSIPESIVFRVSFPVHVGRMRFMSIQFLSGGHPVVRKFRFSPEDDPARLVISNPVSSVRYVISFQSWSRAPIVTNWGKAGLGDQLNRRRLIRLLKEQTQSGDGI